jgi:hypothetical protein
MVAATPVCVPVTVKSLPTWTILSSPAVVLMWAS